MLVLWLSGGTKSIGFGGTPLSQPTVTCVSLRLDIILKQWLFHIKYMKYHRNIGMQGTSRVIQSNSFVQMQDVLFLKQPRHMSIQPLIEKLQWKQFHSFQYIPLTYPTDRRVTTIACVKNHYPFITCQKINAYVPSVAMKIVTNTFAKEPIHKAHFEEFSDVFKGLNIWKLDAHSETERSGIPAIHW